MRWVCSSLKFILLSIFAMVAGDICRRSCRCEPPEDPFRVICDGSSLSIIPQDLPPSVSYLQLSGNSISAIDSTISHYELLKHLDLSRNSLREIFPSSFLYLSRLKHLDLRKNQLSSLSDLKGLSALESLFLGRNHIHSLEAFKAGCCPKIEYLDLSHNHLVTLESGAFRDMNRLTSIDLSGNRFTQLGFLESFRSLPSLEELNLSHNDLSRSKDSKPFNKLNNLRTLKLSGCRLHGPAPNYFSGLNKLIALNLMDNSFDSLPLKAVGSGHLQELNDLKIGSNILNEVRSRAFTGLPRLEKVVISGCHPKINLTFASEAFQSNLNLKRVNITSCSGTTVLPEGLFYDLPHLKHLSLRKCGIRHLTPKLADWDSLEVADLSFNPLACDCSLSWAYDDPQKYKRLRELLESSNALCSNGNLVGKSTVTCDYNPSATLGTLAVILLGLLGGLLLVAFFTGGVILFRKRRRRARKFRRKKLGKICKSEISVITEKVSNPAGYKDVICDESIPLGGNMGNFPDVKTSPL